MSDGKRIVLIDELRGLALINMILYHLCYDLAVIQKVDLPWMFSVETDIWQKYICFSFIIIAGICAPYSKNPFKRAGIVLGCAYAITIATYFFMPSQIVWFGILHLIGFSMLLYALLKKAFTKMPNIPGFILSVVFVVITWNTVHGFFGVDSMTVEIPSTDFPYLYPLGITTGDFYSSDYFPLLPYFFIFTAGVFLSDWVKKWPKWTKRVNIRPLAFIGRHSLIIYMVHQPVLMGILYLKNLLI